MGKQASQTANGRASYGRRAQADFESICLASGDFILAGSGLNAKADHQRLALPAVPGC
jgi:hypothetical protein